MPRVLYTDHPWLDVELETAVFAEHGIDLVDSPAGDEATLCSLAGDVQAIMTCWANVSAGVLDAAIECRHVARMGIGLDNIDVAAATERGMFVTNVPDYCIDEVADQAIGGLLALARNVTHYDRAIKSGVYDINAAPPMFRLSTQTIGLVGFGRTGQATADRARALGMRLLAWSPSGNNHGRDDVEMVSFEKLIAESDWVSVHVPLTDNTHHLMNANVFAAMKSTAYLANTSRGPVVDQAALRNALETGQIAGAALDVWDPEPPSLDDPLLQHPRLIATPHAAFVSVEAIAELRTRAAHQVVDSVAGRTPENVVNAQ